MQQFFKDQTIVALNNETVLIDVLVRFQVLLLAAVSGEQVGLVLRPEWYQHLAAYWARAEAHGFPATSGSCHALPGSGRTRSHPLLPCLWHGICGLRHDGSSYLWQHYPGDCSFSLARTQSELYIVCFLRQYRPCGHHFDLPSVCFVCSTAFVKHSMTTSPMCLTHCAHL